jgi:hypothetical protein
MSYARWSRVPGLVAACAVAALAVAGCSSGGVSPQATQAAADSVANTTTPGAFTAGQLRGALLVKINGYSPATPVESGAYGSLAEVKATKNSMKGVTVVPAKCAQTSVTGFGSPTFAHVPATVETFRVDNNGVSEVLLAPPPSTAALALGKQVPAGCSRYRARVQGKTYTYTVRVRSVRGIGTAARVMNIKATGPLTVNVWSVVYRADNFVGAVTIVGPAASQNVIVTLAAQAYAHAVKTLR